MNPTNPKVDGYIRKNKAWQKELQALRKIVLACDLIEDVKWRTPCYTFENKNVVMIGAMKEYASISFMKGVLLKDAANVLIKPGENTQSARMIKFTTVKDIVALTDVLKAYILEAIEVEKAGLKVKFKSTSEFTIPDELQKKFDKDPAFKAAFHALTPGRQRGYILHFANAKQSKTRTARIENFALKIFNGKGFHD